MKISTIHLHPYQIPLTIGQLRKGALVEVVDLEGHRGWGDIAPLPQRNSETLQSALLQLQQKQSQIIEMEWTVDTCLKQLKALSLFSSVHFGLETALLSILDPLPTCEVLTSALLMGSPQEIMTQAKSRQEEGFVCAKLKVSNLSFANAAAIIHELKKTFRLRIDVNQAWTTAESLDFFSQFSQDDLDYVEDPFQNPHELAFFTHPLAVEESFLKVLTLQQLEALPKLKALIFKPTVNHGLAGYNDLQEWASKNRVSLVLSPAFESDVGLAAIASIICRNRLTSYPPVGIGTYHYMQDYLLNPPLTFNQGKLRIPTNLELNKSKLKI